ncbi:hypothetical protein AHAS_Ahas13G0075900 [Arachis hypogaea]
MQKLRTFSFCACEERAAASSSSAISFTISELTQRRSPPSTIQNATRCHLTVRKHPMKTLLHACCIRCAVQNRHGRRRFQRRRGLDPPRPCRSTRWKGQRQWQPQEPPGSPLRLGVCHVFGLTILKGREGISWRGR